MVEALTGSSPEKDAAASSDTKGDNGSRYLEHVLAEIDQEVQRRRASGELPVRVERELDELFEAFSPVSGTRGREVSEVVRLVDASAFINPVVPIASDKSGGSAIKKTVRSMTMWYMSFITQQINQFTSSVSRSLHVFEGRLDQIQRALSAVQIDESPIVDLPTLHHAEAWWISSALEALAEVNGRVLHVACDDGWLVQVLRKAGKDAYGVDPRPGRAEESSTALDLRTEDLEPHLQVVTRSSLGGAVVSGLVETTSVPGIRTILGLFADVVATSGLLIIHSATPTWWASDAAPAIADLVPGHPIRVTTWKQLLSEAGFDIRSVHDAGGSAPGDFLIVAERV